MIAAGGACARAFSDPFDCEDYEPDEGPRIQARDGEPDGDESDDEGRKAGVDAHRTGPLDLRGRVPWQQSGDVEPLHSGQALTLEEATEVRRSGAAAVVVPVGMPGVGKTTLLAALYEALAAGPIDGWRFAGSLSLMGFEERSHDATVASGRAEPDTARTSQATSRLLLHLSLVDDSGQRLHLLLADVSGEHAGALRVHDDPGDYARPLRAATCVLLMLDGARLADPARRYAAATEARTLFRALHENALIDPSTPVIATATKWDLCAAAPDGPDAAASILNGLASDIAATGRPSGAVRSAARDPSAGPDGGGDGMAAVLRQAARLPARRPLARATAPAAERPAHAFRPGARVAAAYMDVRR